MKTESCDDRILAELASREASIASLQELASSENQDVSEEAYEELANFALEVSTTITLKVLISTGGPADYLTADIDKGKYGYERVSNITYHFADWFDHASVTVADDSSMANYFDDIVENYAY